jgi:hypothetical protein
MLACPTTRRVISASRRTDLPAFYPDWLANRLREGFVLAPHPHAPEPRRVSLDPSKVLGVVLWTKNPGPLLPRLEKIQRRIPNLFFHVTLTAAGQRLEPNIPPPLEVLRDIDFLSRRLSPNHVAWRFDPLCPTHDDPVEAHLERFADLAERMRGRAGACITSFATLYNKLQRRLHGAQAGPILRPGPEERARTFARMAAVAQRNGLPLRVCCDPDIQPGTAPPGACIAPELLAPAWRDPDLASLAKRPTRKACACRESLDLGQYDTCPAGCLYCYATNNPERARANHAAQDPQSPLLGPAGP